MYLHYGDIMGTEKPILSKSESIPTHAFTMEGILDLGDNPANYELAFYREAACINGEKLYEAWYIKRRA